MGERYIKRPGIKEPLRLVFCVTLRTMEADAPIRKQVSRRRVRSVMQDLVYLACRLVRHARYWTLSFGRNYPLAQDMAAGVPSICADLRDDNIANLFGETRQGGDVSRDNYPEGKSVGREGEIIRYRVISL